MRAIAQTTSWSARNLHLSCSAARISRLEKHFGPRNGDWNCDSVLTLKSLHSFGSQTPTTPSQFAAQATDVFQDRIITGLRWKIPSHLPQAGCINLGSWPQIEQWRLAPSFSKSNANALPWWSSHTIMHRKYDRMNLVNISLIVVQIKAGCKT